MKKKDKILYTQINKEKHPLTKKTLRHISSNNEDFIWLTNP